MQQARFKVSALTPGQLIAACYDWETDPLPDLVLVETPGGVALVKWREPGDQARRMAAARWLLTEYAAALDLLNDESYRGMSVPDRAFTMTLFLLAPEGLFKLLRALRRQGVPFAAYVEGTLPGPLERPA